MAIDESETAVASATMMQHYEVGQLGFAATYGPARGKGAHMALLRRRILDGIAAGSRQFFAILEEGPDFPERGSTGARNLVRAGFALGAARAVWRPSEHLLADDEDDRREDEDGEPDDDDGLNKKPA